MKIDFSEFHPLDHWPLTRRCRGLPGGTRNHLHLTWVYRRREQALHPLYKLVLCPLGRHHVQVWYATFKDGTEVVKPTCAHCDWTRLPSEADVDNRPEFFR